MSLTRANLKETVRKQYLYKLNANIDVFSSLVGIQLLALLFSLGGVGSSGMSGSGYTVDVKYYSSDLVIAFTLIWALVTAITITTKPNRNHDFTFVTNRLSSSLSNILFLLTASVIGAITASMSGGLLQVVSSLLFDQYSYTLNIGGAKDVVIGFAVTVLYLFLVNAFGYFIGALVQVSKLFILLIPVLAIGSLFSAAFTQKEPILINIFQFFVMESMLSLFIVKAVLTTFVLFVLAITVFNRMEVRR